MAGRGEVDAVREFVDDFGLEDFPHVVDDTGGLWAAFGVTAQPAWIFVSADGASELVLGSLGGDGLSERLDSLVG